LEDFAITGPVKETKTALRRPRAPRRLRHMDFDLLTAASVALPKSVATNPLVGRLTSWGAFRRNSTERRCPTVQTLTPRDRKAMID
jgi:hypothetical protein